MRISFSKIFLLIFVFVFISSCSMGDEENSVSAAPASLTSVEINTTDVINDPEIFNYDVNKDYAEQIVDFYPFAFFASDLSQNVIDGVNLALKTAAEEWGKYGPVEYWVFGTDKQASLDLINKFCERRETLNQWTMTECLTRETDETADHSMIAYQKVGENAILNNRIINKPSQVEGFYFTQLDTNQILSNPLTSLP